MATECLVTVGKIVEELAIDQLLKRMISRQLYRLTKPVTSLVARGWRLPAGDHAAHAHGAVKSAVATASGGAQVAIAGAGTAFQALNGANLVVAAANLGVSCWILYEVKKCRKDIKLLQERANEHTEQLQQVIKQGDESAEVPFDQTKTTKSETIKSVDQSDDTKKDTSNEEDDSNKKAASGDAADLLKSSMASWSKFQNRIVLSLGGAFACGLLSGAAYIQRQKMAPGPGGPTPAPPHPLRSGLLWVCIISAFVALAFVGIAVHQTILEIYKNAGDGEH